MGVVTIDLLLSRWRWRGRCLWFSFLRFSRLSIPILLPVSFLPFLDLVSQLKLFDETIQFMGPFLSLDEFTNRHHRERALRGSCQKLPPHGTGVIHA